MLVPHRSLPHVLRSRCFTSSLVKQPSNTTPTSPSLGAIASATTCGRLARAPFRAAKADVGRPAFDKPVECAQSGPASSGAVGSRVNDRAIAIGRFSGHRSAVLSYCPPPPFGGSSPVGGGASCVENH